LLEIFEVGIFLTSAPIHEPEGPAGPIFRRPIWMGHGPNNRFSGFPLAALRGVGYLGGHKPDLAESSLGRRPRLDAKKGDI
jgi:hypothetical protein